MVRKSKPSGAKCTSSRYHQNLTSAVYIDWQRRTAQVLLCSSEDTWRHAFFITGRRYMKQMLLRFSQLKLKQKENETLVAPYSRSYGRTLISTIVESDDGGVHAVSLLT